MSRPPRQPPRSLAEPPPIVLIEEAVHLLRRAPVAAWTVYLAGTIPWVLGFLGFWSYCSWFSPNGAQIAAGALVLVALFAWMKTAQAEFCARLLALRLGRRAGFSLGLPRWALLRTQFPLQAWSMLTLPLGLLAVVPFGWLNAYHQNLSVLGAEPGLAPRLRHEAAELAGAWPRQNHLGLASLALFGAAVWVNLASCFYVLPFLANTLFGVENLLAVRGIALLNTTFLALVSALAWLALDPLVKAFYVLRVFHLRSRTSGEDLRLELPARPGPGSRTVATAVLLAALLLPAADRAQAADEPPPPAAATVAPVAPADLDQAIDRALEQSDFQWSLRPLPRPREEKGAVAGFFQDVRDMLDEARRAIVRAIDRFRAWLKRLTTPRERSAPLGPVASSAPASAAGLQGFLYFLIGLAALGLLWVIWQFWRESRRRQSAAQAVADAAPAAVVDLRDEQVTAAQLPADEWLALARQQLAAGDWRLALRALYLAILARHAAEGLIVLARFKTNLDYERELRRRAPARADLHDLFRQRRRAFEDVWYGEVPATEETARTWYAQLNPGKGP